MEQTHKSKTIKSPEQHVGQSLYNLGLGKDFLDMRPRSQSLKEKW
jgi:hypothetical protein